jgi:hypothetical protein
MKLYRHLYFPVLVAVLIITSCSSKPTAKLEEEVQPQTPVKVTSVQFGPLAEYVELNATSAYLEKSFIKASTAGYLQTANAQIGKFVSSKQALFSIITKEAMAIGNDINKLDPAFKFTGTSTMRVEKSGYITEVNHQKGDYVQEGEQLAVISNQNSFVFLLDLPYELKRAIQSNHSVDLTLPDGEKLTGILSSSMPSVDSASQTQRFIIRVNAKHAIPEKLVAKVRITKTYKLNVQSISKAAVLTNETEDEFWVMKLINDTTAVKVQVKKGMENSSNIEILSPAFIAKDRIISEGNYGLADTAKVKIAP